MRTKLFYILNGNNGASYICNTKNLQSIDESLKFYKALSLKSQLLKQGLRWYLWLNRFLLTNKLRNANTINNCLQQMSSTITEFNIHDDCSVFIASTKDKAIVNYHHKYFQKFAFGNSYFKVKKEVVIYKLFPNDLMHFQVSRYFDVNETVAGLISFKLSNETITRNKKELSISTLVPVLIEFFNCAAVNRCSINDYIDNLQKDLSEINEIKSEAQEQILVHIKGELGDTEFPLGLVHRDFKSWNLLQYTKPLIFDFEEAILNGPPLEDLLNYLIDPLVRYHNASQVAKILFAKNNMKAYTIYLEALAIKIEPQIFIHFYVIERMLFWYHSKNTFTSNKYKQLSDYLITQNNKL